MDLRRRPLNVLLTILATGCDGVTEPEFPARASAFVPPPVFAVWWKVVEQCAGRTGRFEDVSWFTVRNRGDVTIDNRPVDGAWFSSGNRIVLVSALASDDRLVRHEMLHALLQTGDHPREYFEDRCGNEIICGRICGESTFTSQDTAGALKVTTEQLTLDAWLTPTSPSLSEFSSFATVTVSATNPLSRAVYVDLRLPYVGCGFGYNIRQAGTADDPFRSECGVMTESFLVLAPHETRRVLFDIKLDTPSYFSSAFQPGPAQLTGRLLESDSPVRTVTIRP